MRGGSWNNQSRNARSANRNRNQPDNRNNNNGFRLVRVFGVQHSAGMAGFIPPELRGSRTFRACRGAVHLAVPRRLDGKPAKSAAPPGASSSVERSGRCRFRKRAVGKSPLSRGTLRLAKSTLLTPRRSPLLPAAQSASTTCWLAVRGSNLRGRTASARPAKTMTTASCNPNFPRSPSRTRELA